MNWGKFVEHERQIWHDRFFPSLIAALAVLIITLVLQRSGFDIVLLTSIASSIVILTNKYKNRLTMLGTAIYSYIIAAVVGFIFLSIERFFNLSIVPISFLTIVTITLLIYLLDVFHPPAVGIALGIVVYQGTAINLLLILAVTFLVFFVIKIIVSFFSE